MSSLTLLATKHVCKRSSKVAQMKAQLPNDYPCESSLVWIDGCLLATTATWCRTSTILLIQDFVFGGIVAFKREVIEVKTPTSNLTPSVYTHFSLYIFV